MVASEEPELRKEIVYFLKKYKNQDIKPGRYSVNKLASACQKVLATSAILTDVEIATLLDVFPERYDKSDICAQLISKILVSELGDAGQIVRHALQDVNNDYRMMLAEWLIKSKIKNDLNSNLSCLIINNITYDSDALNEIENLTSEEADFMLAALQMKDSDGRFYDFNYNKIYDLLVNTEKYSNFSRFSLRSYHFDKFYTVRVLAQYFSGAEHLPPSERTAILTHPPKGMEGADCNPVLEEVTLTDYIAYGMNLKKHLEFPVFSDEEYMMKAED